MARMRTIREALKHVKALDPGVWAFWMLPNARLHMEWNLIWCGDISQAETEHCDCRPKAVRTAENRESN